MKGFRLAWLSGMGVLLLTAAGTASESDPRPLGADSLRFGEGSPALGAPRALAVAGFDGDGSPESVAGFASRRVIVAGARSSRSIPGLSLSPSPWSPTFSGPGTSTGTARGTSWSPPGTAGASSGWHPDRKGVSRSVPPSLCRSRERRVVR